MFMSTLKSCLTVKNFKGAGLAIFASSIVAFGAEAATLVYQEGADITADGVSVAGPYMGTQDTFLGVASRFTWGANNGNNGVVVVDCDQTNCSSRSEALMRFDNLFGTGPGQINTTDTITSATLQLNVLDPGANMQWGSVSTALSWNEATSTGLNTAPYGIAPNVTNNGTVGSVSGAVVLDVTSDLQAWALNPALNNGWGFTPGVDGLIYWASSEYATQAFRPTLTISATPSVVPLPAALPLLLGGMGALVFLARRRSKMAT